MPPGFTRLTGVPPTYEPFGPPPPEQLFAICPIKDGIYSYSSTGMTIKNYRPKQPSEILCTIAEQYEEKEVTRLGQEIRGGRGKKKGKEFFRAHLTWYGLEYSNDDTRDELEEMLSVAMSTRPPPKLPQAIFEKEAELRQRFLNDSKCRAQEIADALVAEGHIPQTSETLAEISGGVSVTDDFFAHPPTFFQKYFPVDAPPDHVVVLMTVDVNVEADIYEWGRDMYRMNVEKVENERATGRHRGRFPDFVMGRNLRAVQAKAREMRQQNAMAPQAARFRPY